MSNRYDAEHFYVPLSEERVVAKLIKERASQDASFYPSNDFAHITTSDGVFPLNEDVICIYTDLERLIDHCGLSEAEMATVKLLMLGYSIADIADHYGKTRQAFDMFFTRAVKKIVRQNSTEWAQIYSDMPMHKFSKMHGG